MGVLCARLELMLSVQNNLAINSCEDVTLFQGNTLKMDSNAFGH